jgi:malate synthase
VARAEFDAILGQRPNQLERQRPEVQVVAADLLGVHCAPGAVTEAGLRRNISVGLRYLASWLSGVGAAAIDDLMEDAATAEISRAQVWQWVRHGVVLETGATVTTELVTAMVQEELDKASAGEAEADLARWQNARSVFEHVALGRDFLPFLTLPAYDLLP